MGWCGRTGVGSGLAIPHVCEEFKAWSRRHEYVVKCKTGGDGPERECRMQKQKQSLKTKRQCRNFDANSF